VSPADAERHLARLEALVAGLEREARESEQEATERQQRRAEDARAGRLGPDWQAVQRRIDSGQTTLQDVFGGRDRSPAAVRLAQRSRETLAQVAEEVPPPPEVVEELAAEEVEWRTIAGVADPAGQE